MCTVSENKAPNCIKRSYTLCMPKWHARYYSLASSSSRPPVVAFLLLSSRDFQLGAVVRDRLAATLIVFINKENPFSNGLVVVVDAAQLRDTGPTFSHLNAQERYICTFTGSIRTAAGSPTFFLCRLVSRALVNERRARDIAVLLHILGRRSSHLLTRASAP